MRMGRRGAKYRICEIRNINVLGGYVLLMTTASQQCLGMEI